ncbi:MAG: hypothetical protein Q8M22_17680 [Actinomycetota bacterium]|nr:hypothetical protein [Actinomycetota bacterium]
MNRDDSAQPVQASTSTSIDDVLAATATATGTGTEAEQPAPAAPPMPPGKQLSGLRVLFGVSLGVLLVAAVLLLDEVGPTVDRSARITERYIERQRKGGDDYVLEGRDDRGGVFEIDVRKKTHQRARVGDQVVVSRSTLTGRVIVVDGPGWSDGKSSWRLWTSVVIGALALLGVVSAVRFSFRSVVPRATPEQRRTHRSRLAMWGVAALLVTTGWVLYERSGANVGAGGAAPGTVTTVAGDDCDQVDGRVRAWLPSIVADGTVTEADISLVAGLVSAASPGCGRSEIVAAVCSALDSPSVAVGAEVVLFPSTLCLGR